MQLTVGFIYGSLAPEMAAIAFFRTQPNLGGTNPICNRIERMLGINFSKAAGLLA